MSDVNSEYVWVSRAPSHVDAVRGFSPIDVDYEDNVSKAMVDAMHRSERGKKVSGNEYPSDIYLSNKAPGPKKIKHFMAYGFFVISEKMANILADFDLGDGGIYPVNYWDPKREEILDTKLYHLNIACKKNALIPEKCQELYKPFKRFDEYSIETVSDDDVVCGEDALKGPDLWFDERIRNGCFLSDRLFKAMKKQKVDSHWHLKRCLIAKA